MKNKRIVILEVPFDGMTLDEVLVYLLKRLEDKPSDSLFVATPNPEMLLEARKNQPFKKILQTTDLNIPDGTGIIWASRLNGTPLPERVTGTDLMEALCQHVLPQTRIFLLGGGRDVAAKVKERLQARREINIVGTDSGSADPSNDENLIHTINAAAPSLLFVAFGAPKQELWLARNLPRLTSVKVAMGVGGAFDFIAGEKKRAPAWMRKIGLEWLFRLIRQPSRFKRIYNATIKFPLVFLGSRFRHH